ncbi:aromatic ring-hydroxylating oxygenase subunit alpha [Nitriliruptor alkaliphilus]|uniref:aromatic ring-hydroxylating oxygenase subunit alpha n=1 Tax=Nitriliruptor alkaliphilus TaxID=427918 RepID=UPI0009FB3AAC|nr:aromatic ring-hydroxylating dioxygenase subunit alpha [Nitriliruptor alkaliphilus]
MLQFDDTAEGVLKRLGDGREQIQAGRMPAWALNSRGIYELERDRLFSRTWQFLGHETEIPSPGDYVTRPIVDNEIILARDEDGEIQAHLNMCRHRGNTMCKAAMGNASHFRCSYHGWTYKNSGELIGVPYLREAYDGKLNRKDWKLVEVRVATYEGLIFGTIAPEAPSLEEFLGGFTWYLDYYLKPGPGGTEVYAPPDSWEADTDWKICAENFAGDGYHTPVAHQFGFELGYFPSSGASHFEGYAAHIPEQGHAIGLGRTPGMAPFAAYPPEVVDGFRQTLSPEQIEVFSEVRTAVGTVFPNLSFLVQPFSRIPGEPGVRFCTMRLWHPIGPGRMRMFSWCLVPTDAPQQSKDESYEAYTLAFGQAGTFEQDDMENWTNVTRQAGSSLVRDLHFPYEMGLSAEPEHDFPGPGVVYSPYVTEAGFRGMWSKWWDYLSTPTAGDQEGAV